MIRRLLRVSFRFVVLLGLPAGGAVVNLDFQVGPGLGVMAGGAGTVLPSAGSYWNTNGANWIPMPLLTSTGAPSGMELVSDFWNGLQTADGDALFGDSVSGDATIRGLAPGIGYQIVIYGAANLQNIYRVDQAFESNSPAYGEITCTYGHTVLPGVEGCDYVQGIATADAEGEITVRVFPGAMSGMQIIANPEPSVMLLHLIAGLGAGRRRRH